MLGLVGEIENAEQEWMASAGLERTRVQVLVPNYT